MNNFIFLVFGFLICLFSCTQKEKTSKTKPVEASKKEATLFLKQFLHSDSCKLLSEAVLPDSAAIVEVFPDTSLHKKLMAYFKDLKTKKYKICPRSEQKELIVYRATTEDFLKMEGEANKFPSPYFNLARKLKEGLTFYRFKFVIAGYEAGNSYDGLVKINGKWIIFPKVWKAFK